MSPVSPDWGIILNSLFVSPSPYVGRKKQVTLQILQLMPVCQEVFLQSQFLNLCNEGINLIFTNATKPWHCEATHKPTWPDWNLGGCWTFWLYCIIARYKHTVALWPRSFNLDYFRIYFWVQKVKAFAAVRGEKQAPPRPAQTEIHQRTISFRCLRRQLNVGLSRGTSMKWVALSRLSEYSACSYTTVCSPGFSNPASPKNTVSEAGSVQLRPITSCSLQNLNLVFDLRWLC